MFDGGLSLFDGDQSIKADAGMLPPATKRLIEMVREKTRLLEDGT